eukprot:COSAG01_NODE_5240_length_4391_cov_2.273299_2_plen_432_part_00
MHGLKPTTLQDAGVWLAGHKRGFCLNGSEQYVCADGRPHELWNTKESPVHCCPSSDSENGKAPYATIYAKDCNLTAGKSRWYDPTNSEPYTQDPSVCDPDTEYNKNHRVDIPWDLACNAGRNAFYLKEFLATPCAENYGLTGTVEGATKWGCFYRTNSSSPNSYQNTSTVLEKLTSPDFVYGVGESEFHWQESPGSGGTGGGYFSYHLATGCHSNEMGTCLGGTGFMLTAVATYTGFALLMWGSLWNANLLQKLAKAKDQWNELRGNKPKPKPGRPLLASGSSSPGVGYGKGGSLGGGAVSEVSSDEEFTQLLRSGDGGILIVDFTATWCGPCKAIAPHFAQLASQHAGAATFLKVDVDECADTAHTFSISAMPTFACFDAQGQLAGTFSGADKDKLTTFVSNALSSSSGGAAKGGGSVAVEVEEEGECTT